MHRFLQSTSLLLFLISVGTAFAASPNSIQRGQQLFEQNWKSGNPTISNDGLGPLFNASSCAACHNQGGLGGGGDARFNAITVGIESIDFEISGTTLSTNANRKIRLLRSFYPGFATSTTSISNTSPLPHHGGSDQYAQIRRSIRERSGARFSSQGGPIDADEVRISSDTPIVFQNTIDQTSITIKANLFHRNTTPLYGLGLVDRISEVDIQKQARLQSRHPEISGRVSMLRDGTIGRFGWRANVSQLIQFVDQACANELSLETKRRRQPTDPARPNYRNPSIDISDEAIQDMSAFIAALPAPARREPITPTERTTLHRGEFVFNEVGCSVCHTPQLGNVSGLYSDLLLHDMGPKLYDFDAAEPYVLSKRLVKSVEPYVEERLITESQLTAYYGRATSIESSIPMHFKSPRRSYQTQDSILISQSAPYHPLVVAAGRSAGQFRKKTQIKRTLQPSNTSQEWRTPPLWGVADSAPYMHDGRAETLLQAIVTHDGESAGTRDRFLNLSLEDRRALIAFMESLVAPTNLPRTAL